MNYKTIKLNLIYQDAVPIISQLLDNKFTGKIKLKDQVCTYSNGKRHSFEDQPAIKNLKDEIKFWCKNGKLHRLSGPAVIHYNKNNSIYEEQYYINDELLTYKEWLNHPLVKAYKMFEGTELEKKVVRQ